MLNYIPPAILLILVIIILFKFIKSTIKTIFILLILVFLTAIIFNYLTKHNLISPNFDIDIIKKTGFTIIDFIKDKINYH